jgi:hypothetical protein
MAWITNDGASTINLTNTSGSAVMFRVKELLKTAGWTVKSSSDGTTYNSSGDQITTAGSGAGGMDNNYAWFRIQDPGTLREYIIQRGTAHYSWKGLYSASDKFTGGSPNATTPPTAGDEQGWFRASTTYQTMFPTSGSWRTHIAAQNAAYNDVYAWWCCCYATTEETTLICDAIDTNTYETGTDDDPCIHYGSDDAPVYTTFCGTSLLANTDAFKAWMNYGETDEEWESVSGLYYYSSSAAMTPVPSSPDFVKDLYDNLVRALPIYFFRHSNTRVAVGSKGGAKYMHFNPDRATYTYGDLIQEGSAYHLVWKDVLLPGWPDSTTPGT